MKGPEAAVLEQGSGTPVILVHGAPSSAAGWAPIAERLARSAKVVTVIAPGYEGASPVEADVVNAQERALLKATQKYGRALWVGFSFGANRILRWAAHKQIDPLALHSIGGFAFLPPEVRRGMKETAAFVRTLPDVKAEPVRGQFCAQMLSPKWAAAHPETLAEIGRWIDSTSTRVLADELDFVADLEPYDLSAIKAPVVARTGTADINVPPERSEHLKQLLPQTEVERVEGAAHALLIEDVSGTADSILKLLKKVG
ncbi:MAG: alpha/beta fold hydrolase [Myxococcaceae bacterium]